MANPGAFPLDPSSDVGKIRVIIGDVSSVPFDPPQSGVQDYTLFSDAELQVFFDTSDGSHLRAGGFAYLSLAGQAAQQAESVKDYDLQIDSRQKATRLQEQAMALFERADYADAAGESGFSIVSTGMTASCPELAECPRIRFGHCGCGAW